MTICFLALKRLLRPGTVALLILVTLCVWAAGFAGQQVYLRPCGIVCEDEDAGEIFDLLIAKDFVPFADRSSMEAAIADGSLDCGAVLLPGVAEGTVTDELDGTVLMLSAPDAFLTEAYEAHIMATLYTASAPTRTVRGAADAGVTLDRELVKQALDAMRAEGYRFRFAIETVDGGTPSARNLGQALAQAAAALLLFAAIVPGSIRQVADADRMAVRIGRKKALMWILLPGLTWQALLFTLAGALALGEGSLALAGYVLLLTALGVFLGRLPFRIDLLLPIFLLGSLACYPIYFDLTEMFPQLGAVRWLLPPCWLPELLNLPIPALAGGALLCAAALGLYPVRRRL